MTESFNPQTLSEDLRNKIIRSWTISGLKVFIIFRRNKKGHCRRVTLFSGLTMCACLDLQKVSSAEFINRKPLASVKTCVKGPREQSLFLSRQQQTAEESSQSQIKLEFANGNQP